MGPDALGLWDLTRWVNDGLLMPSWLESNAKLSDKPHLGKRPRSFGKKNAVFLGKERGLFGKRTRSFLRMTAVGLATQGMPRRQGHAWCAPAGVLVRTIWRFGAHHLMLWCAPKLQAMRTTIHKIQLQIPLMFKKKRKARLFRRLSQITEAICQMQCVLEAFRPCERGHKGPFAKQ